MRDLFRIVPIVVSVFVLSGSGIAPRSDSETGADHPRRPAEIVERDRREGRAARRAVPRGEIRLQAVAGVRTFGDQLRHVAFWNGYVREKRARRETGRQAQRVAEGTVRNQSRRREGAEGQASPRPPRS